MKKYRIAIEETLRKVVEIEAETPGLAVCRAEDEYNEEKHVLSADNFAGADIALSTDDSTVMETLEDVDFIGYVQRRFEECRESISVEDKSPAWHSEVSTTPCMSSANTVRRPGTARRSTCCTGAMPGTTVLPWSS
ncbi:DpnD/PcfM family protein [Bacteroides uniformis]|nr:DpnD/PcfM family protein [Bacteroides uniformis]